MQSTAPAVLPSAPLTLPITGGHAAFASVPAPRRAQGRRVALPAILSLAVAAILSHHLSVLAIAEWGRAQRREVLHTLGFPPGVTPPQTTLQRLFRRLDPTALAAARTGYCAPPDGTTGRPRGSHGVAVDGKAHRSRLACATPSGGPVPMRSACCHELGVVLPQRAIEPGSDKADAERTVAPPLLTRLDWHGRVLTGAALYCQRPRCQPVVAAGGD
jgi:hypothetical protein